MKNKLNALDVMRNQVKKEIEVHYKSVEDFCWDKDLNKATLSNFLNNKKDFQVSTLQKIAKALNKNLVIKLD